MGGSNIYFFEKNSTQKNFQVQKNSTYNIGSIRHEETVLSFSSILVVGGTKAELLHRKPSNQFKSRQV